MDTKTIGLEDPNYVVEVKARWGGCLPRGMNVFEFFGTGDPYFGGNSDDRPLGINGEILERGAMAGRAEFATVEEAHEAAHEAAKAIPNRRPGSVLGVAAWWR